MFSLNAISKKIGARIVNDNKKLITEISSIKNAKNGSITFLTSPKYFPFLKKTKASAIIISEENSHLIQKEFCFLVVKDVNISLVSLISIFNTKNQLDKNLIEPLKTKNNTLFGKNCLIGKDLRYGFDCKIGNNVVIENNVEIGNNVTIDSNAVIHSGSVIGNNVIIGSGSIVGSEGFGNFLDKNKWTHFPHIGNVEINDNVSIGSNCCIDRGTIDNTIIHKGVIIDNLVHIAHNVEIGENTAVAAKVGIAGSSVIGKRNMIGGMVGIVDHINTTDDVIISATSTVHKDIKEPGVYTGIMPLTNHANWKRIALWILKLDKIARYLNLKKV